jgi:predicted acetyltransferase
MKIRQIAGEERTATMFPLQAYAFEGSPGGPEAAESYRRRMAFYTNVTSLIAEADGQALACVGALPMRQNVRGSVFDMAGVASVAAHPSARRRGFIRELLNALLPLMRDQGCAVSALYPFRASFYARYGFVGVPRVRKATFAPGGLGHLLRAELPGEVERLPMREAFDEYDAFTRRLLLQRHGFAVFDEVRVQEFREATWWVAVARVGGETVGAARYRIDRFGGELVADDLLTTGPMGRALLLRFFARHVDQVARVEVTIGADEVPDLWGTDIEVVTRGTVAFPREGGPMVRVLDVAALDGIAVGGDADVVVEVADDPLIAGTYRLVGAGERLSVEAAGGGSPGAVVSAAGLSGMVYGVLDPVDVVTRGLGRVEPAAIESLRTLFPRELPYLFADF